MSQMSKIFVIGNGGHSKVVIDCLINNNMEIAGVITKKEEEINETYRGCRLISETKFIKNFKPEEVQLVNGIGITTKNLNQRIFLINKMKQIGFNFLSIVDKSAIVAKGVQLGEGSQILHGSVIQPDTCIGDHSIVNTSVSIDHDCKIYEHCHIAPRSVLCGEVTIKQKTFVGSGSIIVNNISIEEECIIAAGVTIDKNIKKKSKILNNQF